MDALRLNALTHPNGEHVSHWQPNFEFDVFKTQLFLETSISGCDTYRVCSDVEMVTSGNCKVSG